MTIESTKEVEDALEEPVHVDSVTQGDEDVVRFEGVTGEVPPESVAPSRDPLTTATLAEIYLAQGFHDQALKIYRDLADAAPENDELPQRIAEIERLKSASVDTHLSAGSTAAAGEAPSELFPVAMSPSRLFSGSGPETGDERTVATLEKWLQSIERRRACH